MQNATGCLVGKEQQGEVYFEKTSDRFHAVIAAMAVGVMKGSLKEAVSYAKKRKQGGRRILHWSEVQMILADMALKIKMSEMALAQSSEAVDEKKKGWRPAALAAAVETGNMACSVTTDGIQVLGGVGYMKGFGQEKRFRDARHIQSLLGAAPMKKVRFIEEFV